MIKICKEGGHTFTFQSAKNITVEKNVKTSKHDFNILAVLMNLKACDNITKTFKNC